MALFFLAGCGECTADYEDAIEHRVRDVLVARRDATRTIIVGRMKEGAPRGVAGLSPFTGRWIAFAAELGEQRDVHWVRTFPGARDVRDLLPPDGDFDVARRWLGR